jgi:hypothetical protein
MARECFNGCRDNGGSALDQPQSSNRYFKSGLPSPSFTHESFISVHFTSVLWLSHNPSALKSSLHSRPPIFLSQLLSVFRSAMPGNWTIMSQPEGDMQMSLQFALLFFCQLLHSPLHSLLPRKCIEFWTGVGCSETQRIVEKGGT